ncbi:hypothetical protein R1sor_012273 [Riccia sorocarpa]|uniref:beta-ketoacyl-[acyl-carrier-protein] synthase I n=1 Tax=Riccia sorocarpa TaxID=122646 RepID=A0ABD3I611_9MARC
MMKCRRASWELLKSSSSVTLCRRTSGTTILSPPPILAQRRVVVTGNSFVGLIKWYLIYFTILHLSEVISGEELYSRMNLHETDEQVWGWYGAAEEALLDARWKPENEEDSERTGVAIGSRTCCISEILGASKIVKEEGPNHAAVTTCASGAHSIGDAFRMIQFGDADMMVAGGSESSIDGLSTTGFCRFDPSHHFPFLVDLTGTKCLVVSAQPSGDGRGAILAMTRALQQILKFLELKSYHKKLKPNSLTLERRSSAGYVFSGILEEVSISFSVDYIAGNVIEARAIDAVFKEHVLNGDLLFSLTKMLYFLPVSLRIIFVESMEKRTVTFNYLAARLFLKGISSYWCRIRFQPPESAKEAIQAFAQQLACKDEPSSSDPSGKSDLNCGLPDANLVATSGVSLDSEIRELKNTRKGHSSVDWLHHG